MRKLKNQELSFSFIFVSIFYDVLSIAGLQIDTKFVSWDFSHDIQRKILNDEATDKINKKIEQW
jgi:hypothetical protein